MYEFLLGIFLGFILCSVTQRKRIVYRNTTSTQVEKSVASDTVLIEELYRKLRLCDAKIAEQKLELKKANLEFQHFLQLLQDTLNSCIFELSQRNTVVPIRLISKVVKQINERNGV